MKRTHALVQVALTLMADPMGRHWGYELSKLAGVRSVELCIPSSCGCSMRAGWLMVGRIQARSPADVRYGGTTSLRVRGAASLGLWCLMLDTILAFGSLTGLGPLT